MKALAVTSKGIEDSACIEIGELIGSKCEKKDSCVLFNFDDFADLCILCYKSQSCDRIIYLLDNFHFKNISDIEKIIQNPQLKKWISGKKFKVECTRYGEHDFRSVDVTEKMSITLSLNWKATMDFKNPDVILYFYIVGHECYFGVDFSGFELNKRTYKIFLHSHSIRGTIAYALIQQSGYDKKKTMLDPFSKDGVVCIEAALHSVNFPVNYYRKDKFAFLKLPIEVDFDKFFETEDKKIKKERTEIHCFDSTFRHVDYCKKNAKIAGIDKELNFSRTELEWLDIKFKEKTVDIIVSNPPLLKGPILEKTYNEFFYQSEYILKDKGIMAIATTIPNAIKKHAAKYNLKMIDERVAFSGEQEITLLFFQKEKKSPNKKQVLKTKKSN